MSIMSDIWIEDLSNKKDMISPFAKSQVRKDKNGKKIISYG
ncbi:dCTP deaminase, partial [Rickettsiales bacterium]|nr:dCTP deaminase [Rickettsiales bacterium]